ncbi:MAG: citrate/2-methylcitrate synthase, partial [Oscillospiraceae bacterium]
MAGSIYSQITPEIVDLSRKCAKNSAIDPALYTKYDVKRGLRDLNGNGVLTGLTNISDIHSFKTVNGEKLPCEGELLYRGYNIRDIISHLSPEKNFGFETATYLLLFGELPTEEQLTYFNKQLAFYRSLPPSFVRDVIMKAPSKN